MLYVKQWNAFTMEPYCRHILRSEECGLHILPKLCTEQAKLTSYSIMNVKLAAQVLSSTVSKIC